MTSSLVGSEMCIRDRITGVAAAHTTSTRNTVNTKGLARPKDFDNKEETVSYTHLTLPTICSV
eukprot:1352862-Prorocentrum_lima.AAC.1